MSTTRPLSGYIDWALFFADPANRKRYICDIAADAGVWESTVRKACRRLGVKLPKAPMNRERPTPIANVPITYVKTLGEYTGDDASSTLKELAALQRVPRYDARAA